MKKEAVLFNKLIKLFIVLLTIGVFTISISCDGGSGGDTIYEDPGEIDNNLDPDPVEDENEDEGDFDEIDDSFNEIESDIDESALPPIEGINNYGYDIESFINAINEARKNGSPCAPGGLEEVRWDDNLAKAALNHSLDMAKNDFFSHTGSDGSSFVTRVRNTDFTGFPAGENIAAGYSRTSSVMNGWLNSTGHCNNIMKTTITHVGYAWVYKSGTEWRSYRTMVTGIGR